MAPNHFVILFRGKEGTSALVRILDHLPQLSVLHQMQNKGWEPFDRHNCGSITLPDLRRCLNLIYGPEPLDMDQLNHIYTRTAKAPLAPVDKNTSVGFKMRFVPPNNPRSGGTRRSGPKAFTTRLLASYRRRAFKRLMFDVLGRYNVVTFVAVRQDVLRWALSHYHGDGTGRPGHLQRIVANGLVTPDAVPKIEVDCDRLGQIVASCEANLARKRVLVSELDRAGIDAHPLLYEDFCRDPHRHLAHVLDCLGIPSTGSEIDEALQAGTRLQKVHADDISQFVTNHEKVLDRFGERYITWS